MEVSALKMSTGPISVQAGRQTKGMVEEIEKKKQNKNDMHNVLLLVKKKKKTTT